jgi:Phage tail assembly chaperone
VTEFKIAQSPTFKADVDIPRIGAAAIKVPFEFKYRNRIELAELFSGWSAQRTALQQRIEDQSLSFAEVAAAEIELQVQQIKALVVGWGFDEPLDDESIRRLVETSVNVPSAVIATYTDAFHQARLGN